MTVKFCNWSSSIITPLFNSYFFLKWWLLDFCYKMIIFEGVDMITMTKDVILYYLWKWESILLGPQSCEPNRRQLLFTCNEYWLSAFTYSEFSILTRDSIQPFVAGTSRNRRQEGLRGWQRNPIWKNWLLALGNQVIICP